jgi:hypothetical protein
MAILGAPVFAAAAHHDRSVEAVALALVDDRFAFGIRSSSVYAVPTAPTLLTGLGGVDGH